MVFIDNKYTRIYNSIIENARNRETPAGRLEKHHIIPKCFFKTGTKSNISPGWLEGNPQDINNLINLTPREHFICHLLLVKMCTNNIAKSKMVFALTRFINSPFHIGHITSRRFEEITKLKAQSTSLMNKGRKRTTPIRDETRRKLSEASRRRRKGHTPEHLANVIASNKSRIWTNEMREKLRQHNLGKTNTTKGKTQERLTCPHCGLTGGKSAMKHWHMDKCKYK